MTPWVLSRLPNDDVKIFHRIKTSVAALPDLDLGKDIEYSCHLLARAAALRFALKCVDGTFAAGWEHSWLESESGNIIDVYPVALLGGPVLLDGSRISPWRRLFVADGLQSDLLATLVSPPYVHAVRKVSRALR